MQSGGISRKDVFRKWDEGLFDGKRTPYIIVCCLVYVGGKYWFVVLLHKKCFQWKPCAKAAGNQSSVSWHLQHMSVYVYLYMSIYRVLSLHFECVILICTRLWPFWLNLKPAGHLVCNSMPSAPGGNGVVAAAPATAKQSPPVLRLDLQDQTFSIVTTTPHFLSRGIPPSGAVPAPDNMSQSVRLWAMGHLHLARRLCTRMLCFVPQLLCVLGWVNLPWKFWRSTTNLI